MNRCSGKCAVPGQKTICGQLSVPFAHDDLTHGYDFRFQECLFSIWGYD